MNLPIHIARRYLFAKKSTNAINIITSISVLGITIGTAALILVLSVFNGFEDLILKLFSNFNPDVKVTPAQGKTFYPDSIALDEIRNLEGVEFVAQSLEEVAFFEYKKNQDFGIVKGVDTLYVSVTSIDSTLREGKYMLTDRGKEMAVLGVGMRNKLHTDVEDQFTPLGIYMPKQEKVGPLQQPFRKQFAYPAGTFVIQQDFDNQYILTSLQFAQDLMNLPNQIGALEIKLTSTANKTATVQKIRELLGDEFVVKDRYQQDEAFLKLMNIEKWMSFAILSLTLLLVAFNIVGSLWMIVLEKKKDIAILKSMGAPDILIRNIFLNEGLLLCTLGMMIGFVIALILYTIQKTYGIIPIPAGFVVDAYPMSIRWFDFLAVAAIVIGIGLLASFPPAIRAMQVSAMVREE